MYYVYLDTMLCPISPSKIQIQVNNKNKTVTTINYSEVNILKTAGLTDIAFDLLLPNSLYPFAIYSSGFKNAKYFLDKLERLKQSKNPFQFIIVRVKPNNKIIYNTNIRVALESYTITENAQEGFDVIVSIKLKQYKEYSVKTYKFIPTENNGNDISKIELLANKRETNNSPAPTVQNKTYIVASGDCLWSIAKKFYGDGSLYMKIYHANADKIKNPNLIVPGQVLTIPL